MFWWGVLTGGVVATVGYYLYDEYMIGNKIEQLVNRVEGLHTKVDDFVQKEVNQVRNRF